MVAPRERAFEVILSNVALLRTSTSIAPAAQLPPQTHAHVTVDAGAGQPWLGVQGAVDEGDAGGRFASVGWCGTNAAPSSTSSHSTAWCESSDAWMRVP